MPNSPAHPDDPHKLKRRGMLFVLSSPSGAGKSTIARKLLADDDGLQMSVSATTRGIRPGEVDGKDYHFVGLEEFRRMVANDEFLEWAHVFDNRYGTPRAQVEAMLAAGKDVLFDIDWQGAQQLFQIAGGDVVRVFIFPVDGGTAPATRAPRDRLGRGDRRPHGPRGQRGQPLGWLRLCPGQ